MFYSISRVIQDNVADPSAQSVYFGASPQSSILYFGCFKMSFSSLGVSLGDFENPKVIRSGVTPINNVSDAEEIEGAFYHPEEEIVIFPREDGCLIFDSKTKETWFVYESEEPRIYLYLKKEALKDFRDH